MAEKLGGEINDRIENVKKLLGILFIALSLLPPYG